MSDNYKCAASQDGICRNVYAFGVKCNGYSKNCKLRPAYESVDNAYRGVANSLRRAFGIEGDNE